ncbi:MAG TPA: beta-1,6-N-acetylglucosaminyltransferase, partial [Flavitalea sp.]|nr:beta-1,6-N-acetylglucosaminyltransferase [Flavitalea sp.]
WWINAADRYKYYHLNDYRFYGKKLLYKISKRVLPHRRFLYPDYQLYGGPGATFCALTRQAAEYIINFMQKNPKARQYAKFTHASDEFWFQTLLMNSPLKDKMINEPLWYIDWSGTSKHPCILNVLDYPSLIASGMFFARKFDMYEDEIVMDMLDGHLNERKNRRSLLAE